MLLAMLIIASWLGLHIHAIFFLDAIRPLPALAAVIALTWLSVGMYIVAHDAMHGSLCPSMPRLGRAAGALAVWLYAGFSFAALQAKHGDHHRFPGTDADPDFASGGKASIPAWYGRFMTTYFSKREMLRIALRAGVYLLLGARLENILLFFALPGLLSSFQLFYFGTYLPHRHAGTEQTGFRDHHKARSNDYGYGLSLLTCFHFGYHHEHHLQPGTPWWRLPSLRGKENA
jgi:beta-carotene ketolase (CrtW type)